MRSGGVAGIRRAHALDTSALDAHEARRVEHLVACAVAAPPAPEPELAADRFDYVVLIDATRWRVGEQELQGPWRDLVQELVRCGHRTAPPDC